MFKRNKSKEDDVSKKEQKQLDFMKEQYGLTDLDEVDLKVLRKIGLSQMGVSAMTLGSKSDTKVLASHLEVITEQNFMIIRLLREINDKLDK